jgi:hypothetical protein
MTFSPEPMAVRFDEDSFWGTSTMAEHSASRSHGFPVCCMASPNNEKKSNSAATVCTGTNWTKIFQLQGCWLDAVIRRLRVKQLRERYAEACHSYRRICRTHRTPPRRNGHNRPAPQQRQSPDREQEGLAESD